MPHSSGGGSHGGGSHGGSHGSSNHVSRSYFPGSRRYRRHYSDGRPDEYVYATRKPSKTTLSSVIIVGVMAAFFMFAGTFGILGDVPRKLKTEYMDSPKVYDEFDLIANDDALEEVIDEYCDVTGICPVIITTYDEIWNSKYSDLESYAFDQYVDNYKDEQHFVIVYSIPMEQAIELYNGEDFVPDYQWEAIQGDETDPIITESYFKKFADRVQDKLEDGEDPGEAFDFAFMKATSEAESRINPTGPSYYLHLAGSCIPMLIILAIFVPMMILMIKQYKKDKNSEYEQVPLSDDDAAAASEVSRVEGISIGGFSTTYTRTSNGTESTVKYDPEKGGSKLTMVISLVILIPFFIMGLVILFTGISMLSTGADSKTMSFFMIGFAVIWLLGVMSVLGTMLRKVSKLRKKENEPVNISYPTSEYAEPVMPGQEPAVTTPSDKVNNAEFDPQFFQSSNSTIEDDDEDYKRMKRQGFE